MTLHYYSRYAKHTHETGSAEKQQLMVESIFGTAKLSRQAARLNGNKDSDGVVTSVHPAGKDKEKIVVIRLNC